MTARLGNPFQIYLDRVGLPLDGGKLYIGSQGNDPESAPIQVYLDEGLTLAVPQPISVIGGLACHDGTPALFYVSPDSYSIRARDIDGAEVFYTASAVGSTTSYQPLDSDLTAIAALATTAFGRGVLTAANAAALRSYAGIVDALPLAGGTMTGAIIRSSAGAHPYMADATYSAARIFVTANGAADPTSAVGDIWLEEAP